MAAAFGMIGGCRSSSSWTRLKDPKKKMRSGNGVRVCCISSSSRIDPYRTLRIQPGASESEVKKAFRQLALKYHPDVCSGSNCGVQFHQIYEAYDIVMNNLRNELTESESEEEEVTYEPYDASAGGSYDPNNLWEEWMGWEGAGIRDYSSHINPNI